MMPACELLRSQQRVSCPYSPQRARRSVLRGQLRVISEPLFNPTSHLSSAPVSYPIPRDNHVAVRFAQAGFSGRGSARRSPSRHASTPRPLELWRTHSSRTLPWRSLQRAPQRCRDSRLPEPPSPLTRRGASTLLPVCGLPPLFLPPLPTDGVAALPLPTLMMP